MPIILAGAIDHGRTVHGDRSTGMDHCNDRHDMRTIARFIAHLLRTIFLFCTTRNPNTPRP